MHLLNIFHTGGVTLALTLIWLGLSGWFYYQAQKERKQEYGFNDPSQGGKWVKLADKTPWKKIPFVLYIIICLLLYIICMLAVASDYKGV